MPTEKFLEGRDNVLEAIAELVASGQSITAENFDEFAEKFKPKPNPYTKFSIDTLRVLSSEYAYKLGMGQTILGNGENLGEAYEQVCEAIEYREEQDYCKHGVFRWTDHDIPCGACEME